MSELAICDVLVNGSQKTKLINASGIVLDVAALLTALSPPTKFAAVTPSDSTDLTLVATKGLIVTVAGLVYVQGTGDAAIVSLGTFPVGSFIPGSFLHVGVSTTATVIACGG